MSEVLIASLLQEKRRFFRSTDLVRDFDDPQSLDNYWLTDFSRACLEQIADSLRDGSTRRAWRITGDFGSGKSSFALLLARAFGSYDLLPRGLKGAVGKTTPEAKTANFLPILVAGSREPMSNAVVRALASSLGSLNSRGAKSALLEEMEGALKATKISDQQTIEFLKAANAKLIQSKRADGIILIMDEVGKFLEFAAMAPKQQDVFFLQQLAEAACRSAKQPLVVICLLHQSINAYAEQLAKTTATEWEKIAGRFEEISFSLPLDQVAQLAASALGTDRSRLPKRLAQRAQASMEAAIRLGWYGTASSRDSLRALAEPLFPLDSMVLPVLVRVLRRFGQNERSLFGFLCSHEPFGMRAFAQQPLRSETQPYQLADLYDYVRANLGHRLNSASFRSHWNVIESTIESFPENDDEGRLGLRILKTVGLLTLLNSEDLVPTEEAIAWSVGGNSEEARKSVVEALTKIASTTFLHFRGPTRGYSIWPHTSVDLDEGFSKAKDAIPYVGSIAEAITSLLPSQPLVARSHYIKTGNLRYFDVVHCQPEQLMELASSYRSSADGFILIPLCESAEQSATCEATAKTITPHAEKIRLVAVPPPLTHLTQAVLDAMRWSWVQTNTPELNNDKIARDEVKIYLDEANYRLKSQVQNYLGLNRHAGESSLRWFHHDHEGYCVESSFTGRKLMEMLSTLCDIAFNEAPIIKNELVNRHTLSSAAAAARMRLVELMFASADKPDLGLPADRKPPEKSMYLSVLKKTGLHREINGQWQLSVPDNKRTDHARIRPVLKKIKSILKENPDRRVGIDALMRTLRCPPYGLRDGLFPILLAIVAIEDEQEIAFYENGTFLREIGRDAFLRMTKAPEKFEIQFCKIEGVRSQLFQQLASILELSQSGKKDVELLDVVRNLCQFVAQLPEYVRQTKNLSNPKSVAVRDVIMDAREPVRMVFHDLPKACGFAAFEVGQATSNDEARKFVAVLKAALDELRYAFHALHRRMADALAEEFDYQGLSLNQFRRKLAGRAEQLLLQVTENKLKAFAFRVFDEGLSESDWLNSVGSVLALRPPERWKDDDENTFHRELQSAAGRFKRSESVAFGHDGGNDNSSHGFRVAITQADGTERQEVIHFDEKESQDLAKLEQQLAALIKKSGRLGVAAASRVIWSQLKEEETQS